jgi:hypothetical protein
VHNRYDIANWKGYKNVYFYAPLFKKKKMEFVKKVIQTDQDYNDLSLLVGYPLEKGKNLRKTSSKSWCKLSYS